jgi:hypothetical protein
MDPTLWSRNPLATRPSRYDTGAFATHDIEEGTIVIPEWNEASDGEGWIRLDRRQVQKLPPPAKALFRRYGLDTDFDEILGPVDISFVTDPDNFINHACDPNLRYDTEGNVVAARDIRKGEEVFIDYGFFVVNFDEPFTCACGARTCRGRIRRQDWKKLAATYGMNMPRFLHSRIATLNNEQEDERRARYAPQAMLAAQSSPVSTG